MFIDDTDLLDIDRDSLVNFKSTLPQIASNPQGIVLDTGATIDVSYNVSDRGFGIVKPAAFADSRRRAPGTIQMALSTILQDKLALDKAEVEYDNLLEEIEDQVELMNNEFNLFDQEITVLTKAKSQAETMNKYILILN